MANSSSLGNGGTVDDQALLSWTPPPGTADPGIAQATSLAKGSDAAIVVRDYMSEGSRDRSR